VHVVLRPATSDDRAFLFELYAQTMRDVVERTWGWDDSWQRADFERRFAGCSVSVAVVGGRPIGGLFLETRSDALFIHEIQVLPECQGRGIGTALLQGIVAQARARNLPTELAVVEANERARRLYERLGFTVVALEPPFIRMRHTTR
jgi:ribosomal protein S18 acetylase RimI-like enzyme